MATTKAEPETIIALRCAIAQGEWVFLGEVLMFPYELRGSERGRWHLLYWHARRRMMGVVQFNPEQLSVIPFHVLANGPALYAPFTGEYCDLSANGRLVTSPRLAVQA
jgi:hypothetical protein